MLRRNPAVLMAVAAFVLLLGACDESEQGRILHYKKGTYLGKPDTPLGEEQVEKLRQRATLQAGS